jgi:hypothetical protein
MRLDEKGCWIWQGLRDCYGKPVASVKGRIVRVAYNNFERKKGFRPRRLVNTCGNKDCVNPDHLAPEVKDQQVKKLTLEIQMLEPKRQYLLDCIQILNDEGSEAAKGEIPDFEDKLKTLDFKIAGLKEKLEAAKGLASSMIEKEKDVSNPT